MMGLFFKNIIILLVVPPKFCIRIVFNAKFWRDNYKYYGIFEKKAHHNSKWSLKLPQKSHYQRMVARVPLSLIHI